MPDAPNEPQGRVTLDVLHCPGCNAPTPLGREADVTCPYCGVAFPLPEKHRALRDAELGKTEGRKEAAELYETLGHPPGVIARAWGGIAVGCVWLVLWPIALVVDGLLAAKALEIVSRSIHATLYDVWPNWAIWTGIGVALYATLAVPLAFGIYGNRRTKGRQQLQAALAALPPDREGGPARCRQCGAPLDVRAGEFGLACIYCGADNLVRMPEAWVSSLREKAKRLGATIETAGREDREMRTKERRSLRRQLAWLAIFIPLMAVFGIAFDRDADAYPPAWRKTIAEERKLLPFNRDDVFVPSEFPADGTLGFLTFDKTERGTTDDGTSYAIRKYLVPLRYGETVEFTGGDFPDKARALGFTFRTQVSAVFGDDWRQIGKDVILYPNATASFVVPRSAWYRLDVMVVDEVPLNARFRWGLRVRGPD